jgi:ketopantoate reductase
MGVSFLRSSDEAEAFGKALMVDIIAVGRKSSVPLDDSLAEKYIAYTNSQGNFQPSMVYDFKAGLSLEVDVIIGTPMQKVKEFGMEAQSLRAVYALISAFNGRLKYLNVDIGLWYY